MSEYADRLRELSRDARHYLAATVLSSLGFGVQSLLFNLFLIRLGFDAAFVGLVTGIPAFVLAALALPAGLVIQRLGYRRAILLGQVLQMGALALQVAVPAKASFLLAGGLLGLGSSLSTVAYAPFLAASSGAQERTHLFSLQAALGTLSGVLASLVGGALPGLAGRLLGWELDGSGVYRAALAAGCAVFAFSFLPLFKLRPSEALTPLAPAREESTQWRRTAGRLVLIQAVVGAGAGLLIPFVNVFYKTRFALPDPLLGGLFAGSSVVTALGMLAVPFLVGRLGKVRTAVASQSLSIPFLLLMGFSPLLGCSAVGFLVRTALMNMVAPAIGALFMELVPERRRSLTSGLVAMGWNVPWAVSALLSGRLQVEVGFRTIFVITAALYALVPALMYAFFRRASEERDMPAARPRSAIDH